MGFLNLESITVYKHLRGVFSFCCWSLLQPKHLVQQGFIFSQLPSVVASAEDGIR